MPADNMYRQHYERVIAAVGARRDLCWGSMLYACQDAALPERPVPEDWDDFVKNAPPGYWETHKPPEIISVDGRRYFPRIPAGCGTTEWIWLGVGVEGPPDLKISRQYIPAPFIVGPCRTCGRSLQHIRWSEDKVFSALAAAPSGTRYFRVPDAGKAAQYADEGYGGAELVAIRARGKIES